MTFSQSVIFVQKAGGFGGKRTSDKLIGLGEPPKRPSDSFLQEVTSVDQVRARAAFILTNTRCLGYIV